MRSLLLAGLMIIAGLSHAQDLPKPSPKAKVEQRVGLTDITVEYSRPGVKGRDIWGELVPYGEIWRAGANKATALTTSTDIMIEGKKLSAGTYSLFIIPKEDGMWTIILNSETELWGAGDLDPDKDVMRFDVKSNAFDQAAERMEYHIIDINEDKAVMAIDWAGVRATFNIEVDSKTQALKNIDEAIAEADEETLWRVYRNAASYARDQDMTEEGLAWMAKSMEAKESWYSYWLNGMLLAQSGDMKAAVKQAEMAIKKGEADAKEEGTEFGYKERIEADIAEWSGK